MARLTVTRKHARRRAGAALLCLLLLAGLVSPCRAVDRYSADVRAEGQVSRGNAHIEEIWYFQRPAGDLLPIRVMCHNNNPGGEPDFRAQIYVSLLSRRPGHWDESTLTPSSWISTAWLASGESGFGTQSHLFQPELRFRDDLPPGVPAENDPRFHNFRPERDGEVIPMREKLKYRVTAVWDTGHVLDGTTTDSAELVLYVTGEVGLAAPNDTSGTFTTTGRIPVVHLFSRPDLLGGMPRPGAIDAYEDDILRACSCDESCIAGGISVENNSVDLRIGVGTEDFEIPRSIRLKSDVPVASLAQPEGLELDAGLVKTLDPDPGGDDLMQIEGERCVVKVDTIGEQEYRLDFFHRSEAGDPDGDGIYHPDPAQVLPHTSIHFKNPDGTGAFGRLHVTRTTGPGSAAQQAELFEYQYTAATDTWELVSSGGARKELTLTTPTASGEIEARILQDASGGVISESSVEYREFPFGRAKVRQTVDPDGRALITEFGYYDQPADGDRLGALKYTIGPSGAWTLYRYDDFDRVTKRVRPAGDGDPALTPATYNDTQDDQLHVTATVFDDNPSAGEPHETVIETYLGVEVSRRYTRYHPDGQDEYTCQTPGASMAASDNLVTRLRKYTNGDFAGDLRSEARPDGTMTLYSYQLAAAGKITTIDTGAPNAAGDAITDGTRTVTTTNSAGTVTAHTSTDILSGKVIDSFTSTTDESGRPLVTTYLDGTTKSEQRDCCAVTSSTDRFGITTESEEDELTITEKREGVARITTESASARPGGGKIITVTRSELDAAGNPTGPATLLMREEYDAASLLVSSYSPPRNTLTDPPPGELAARTHLQFDTAQDPATGRMVRTSTAADGGTLLREFYQDGRLARETGTSIYGKRYEYGVKSPADDPQGNPLPAQFFTRQILLDASGADTAEWSEFYIDMLGRDSYTRHSRPSGTPATALKTYCPPGTPGTGQLASATDPDGVRLLYAYDARGRLRDTAVDIDQDGAIDYDGSDRITRISHSFGERDGKDVAVATTEVWTTDGDAAATAPISKLERSTDGLDTWTTLYDTLGGNPVALTTHSSAAYSPEAQMHTVTTTGPDGSVRTQIYTASRIRSDTLRDAGGNQISATDYLYDALNRIAEIRDSHDGISEYQYYVDDLAHKITTPDPDGDGPLTAGATTYTYTAGGDRDTVTHPDNSADQYTYHPTGEIHTSTGTRRTSTTTTYDHAGRIKTFSGGGSGAKTWNYDPASGLPASVHDALGQGPSYTYTPAGRLQTTTRARTPAVVTSNVYNNAGELEGDSHSDGTPGTALAYDRAGNIEKVTHGPAVHSFEVTPAGRVERESIAGGPQDGLVRDPGYDPLLLRRNSLQVGLGSGSFTQSFGYDGASRIKQLAAGENLGSSPSATYSYHPGSNHLHTTSFADPGGATQLATTHLVDQLGRTASLASTGAGDNDPIATSFTYTHNQAGQRSRLDLADGSYWTYGYDPSGQLASAARSLPNGAPIPSQSYDFTTDAARNRLTAKRGGGTITDQTVTPNSLNAVASIAEGGRVWVTGSADPAASVTIDGAAATRPGAGAYFEHALAVPNTGSAPVHATVQIHSDVSGSADTDTRSVLVAPASDVPGYDADGNLTSDAKWTYTWNAKNQLVAIESAPGLPATAAHCRLEFDYDYRGRRIAKRAYGKLGGAHVLATDTVFAYDGDDLVAEFVNGNLSRSYLWGITSNGAGGLLAITDHHGGRTYFPSFDASGNLCGLTDSADGESAARYSYSPFGTTTEISGRAAHLNPLRYSGKYLDTETGLYCYGARYYNPETARWLKRDPAGISGGANEYAFLGNDPINQVDIGGYAPWRTIDYIGFANEELEGAMADAERARYQLDLLNDWRLDEINSAQLDCGLLAELHDEMVTSAVEMGIHLNRASILARDYYTEANPVGAREAYAEKLYALRQSFADAAHLDYARLGHMRNSIERLGVDINQQLNVNEDTIATSKVLLTTSLTILEVADAPGFATLAVGAAKLAVRKSYQAGKRAVHELSGAATKSASTTRAATSSAKENIYAKAGSQTGNYKKVAEAHRNRPAETRSNSTAHLVRKLDTDPDRAYFEIRQMIREGELDFSTAPNEAVFWADKGMDAAQAWRGKTLEQTSGGKELIALNLFGKNGLDNARAAKLWNMASNKFATNASGQVNVFSTGASKIGPFGMRAWWRIEKQILIRNSNVSIIIRRQNDGTLAQFGHIVK